MQRMMIVVKTVAIAVAIAAAKTFATERNDAALAGASAAAAATDGRLAAAGLVVLITAASAAGTARTTTSASEAKTRQALRYWVERAAGMVLRAGSTTTTTATSTVAASSALGLFATGGRFAAGGRGGRIGLARIAVRRRPLNSFTIDRFLITDTTVAISFIITIHISVSATTASGFDAAAIQTIITNCA